MPISLDLIRACLACCREVGKSEVLEDMHVHPLDVFSQPLAYQAAAIPGVFSIPGRCYESVQPWPINDPESEQAVGLPIAIQAAARRLLNQRRFWHAGPTVLRSHMQLCGLRRALLLLAGADQPSLQWQLQCMRDWFPARSEFRIAVGVVELGDAASLTRQLAPAGLAVAAAKLHPNVNGMDLADPGVRLQLEELLSLCGSRQLPLIVHGGRSPDLAGPTAEYAVLDNLLKVDWGISSCPVVIAHAGCYGCSEREAVEVALPQARQLLDRHANIWIDLAGLALPLVVHCLQKLPRDRMLFGSDALYWPQWQPAVTLCLAAARLGESRAELLLRIAGRNARSFWQTGAAVNQEGVTNHALDTGSTG